MWSIAERLSAVSLLTLVGTPPSFGVDLSIQPQAAGQSASVQIAINLASHGESVSALQFDLAFDASALNLSPIVGDATRGSGKTLYVGAAEPTLMRFVVAELNQNAISDGGLVNLFVNVGPNVSPGSYAIHFQSALASDAVGERLAVSTTDGTITVLPVPGPSVSSAGVLNGASFTPGPVAPGEVITIIGSGISPEADQGTTSVNFDGLAAPLLYAASNQINAVVPFGIDGETSTTMDIMGPSGRRASIALPVSSSAPGIFTLDGSGTGQGAILNQNGTVNSPDNPADAGSIIVLYATGAGQTTPPGTDGLVPTTILPSPRLPVSVQVGGVAAEILYAGAAPGLISGVLQVNCRIPADVEPALAVPVVLSVGGAVSPPVTIAVR